MTINPNIFDISDLTLFEGYQSDPEFDSSDVVEDYFLSGSPIPSSPMSRARHWCFTLNNYTTEDLERICALEGQVDYLIFGKEVGESGTPHLQGFVSFSSRVRITHCQQTIGRAYFAVARHVKQSIEYCKKDGDVTQFGVPPKSPGRRNDLEDFKNAVMAGVFDMKVLRLEFSEVIAKYPKFVVDFVQDYMPRKEVQAFPLRPWQARLYSDLLLPPDDRQIIFVVDPVGNQGKSWFCHYYASLHDNAQVLLPGKKADMTYVLDPLVRVLFCDAPRSKQGDVLQYDFFEEVKNGYIFSPKYESRVKSMKKCHVVVMMNEMPDESKLSRDRYDIRVV